MLLNPEVDLDLHDKGGALDVETGRPVHLPHWGGATQLPCRATSANLCLVTSLNEFKPSVGNLHIDTKYELDRFRMPDLALQLVTDTCLTACSYSLQNPHLGFHEPALPLVMPPTPTAPKTRKVKAMSTTTIATTTTTIATAAVMLLSRRHVSITLSLVLRSLLRCSFVFRSLYDCWGCAAGWRGADAASGLRFRLALSSLRLRRKLLIRLSCLRSTFKLLLSS